MRSRLQAIGDYVEQLRKGIAQLEGRSNRLQATFKAELARIDAEMSRYRKLITEAERELEDEARFVATISEPRVNHILSARSLHSTGRVGKASGDTAAKVTKGQALKEASVRILSGEGRPIKRADLAKKLQSLGFLADSGNPIDLVRKVLQHDESVRFDVKRGYFLADWES